MVVIVPILNFLLIHFWVSGVIYSRIVTCQQPFNIKLDIGSFCFVFNCFLKLLSAILIKRIYHALSQTHELVAFKKNFSSSFLPRKCQQLLLIIKQIVYLFYRTSSFCFSSLFSSLPPSGGIKEISKFLIALILKLPSS